jgi:DNA gyrase/topoisomerase IV subunit A
MVALDGGRPLVMNLKDMLAAFIAFREEVVSRRTKFLLNKARDRAHILVGLAIAAANIDEVIRLIPDGATCAACKHYGRPRTSTASAYKAFPCEEFRRATEHPARR